jgi:hypothetical protein
MKKAEFDGDLNLFDSTKTVGKLDKLCGTGDTPSTAFTNLQTKMKKFVEDRPFGILGYSSCHEGGDDLGIVRDCVLIRYPSAIVYEKVY